MDRNERQRRRRERERRADEAFFDGLLIGTYWQRESQTQQRNDAVDPWCEDEDGIDAWDDIDDFSDDLEFFG